MVNKKSYDYDKTKALPNNFEPEPPESFEGDMEDDEIGYAQASLLNNPAAQRVGSILNNMDKNDIDALYGSLSPVVRKIRWYRSRYNAMQNKIWYLSDENAKLLKQVQKMRRRLEELGVKSGS